MLEINNLSKQYKRNIVLSQINLKIEKGAVYALLGKNGAGKSTLINAIVDLIKPENGEILVNGKPHNQLNKLEKANIGLIGEDLALIEELNGIEFLTFVGKIYKIQPNILEKRIADLISYFFENEQELNKNIAKYSTGMKKKVAFCAAVLHTPDLLILDEPFSGLDPLVANKMIEFLKLYKKESRTIFISSHDLHYVQQIATHIGVLDGGKIQFSSTLQDFTENGINSIDEALLKIIKPNESDLKNMDWV